MKVTPCIDDEDRGECPHCREVNKYYPFPLWISVLGFFIIGFVIAFIYLQYLVARKNNEECEARCPI